MVLSGRWSGYGNESIRGLKDNNNLQEVSGRNFFLLEKSTESTVNFLNSLGARVILINNTPNFNELPLNCLAENRKCKGFVEPIYFLNNNDRFKGKVKILDFNSRLCPERKNCEIVVDQMIAYSDKTHLSNNFSNSLIDLLELEMK